MVAIIELITLIVSSAANNIIYPETNHGVLIVSCQIHTALQMGICQINIEIGPVIDAKFESVHFISIS